MASVVSLQPFFFPQICTLQARNKPPSLSWACTDTTVSSTLVGSVSIPCHHVDTGTVFPLEG